MSLSIFIYLYCWSSGNCRIVKFHTKLEVRDERPLNSVVFALSVLIRDTTKVGCCTDTLFYQVHVQTDSYGEKTKINETEDSIPVVPQKSKMSSEIGELCLAGKNTRNPISW